MEFYIFWGFNAVMALVFIFIMSFTLERGASHKRAWKEIFKALFKRLGIVLVLYIIIIFIGVYTNHRDCSPNKEDLTIMTPMAEAISNYIIKNGIPNSMRSISNLPYKFTICRKSNLNGEICFYEKNNTQNISYEVELFETSSLNIYRLRISRHYHKTSLYVGITLKKLDHEKWRVESKDTEVFFGSNQCNSMKQ